MQIALYNVPYPAFQQLWDKQKENKWGNKAWSTGLYKTYITHHVTQSQWLETQIN